MYGVTDAHRQFALQNVDPCVLVLHAGDLYPLSGELSGSSSSQSPTHLFYGLEEGHAAGDRSGIQLARHTIRTKGRSERARHRYNLSKIGPTPPKTPPKRIEPPWSICLNCGEFACFATSCLLGCLSSALAQGRPLSDYTVRKVRTGVPGGKFAYDSSEDGRSHHRPFRGRLG